jgi:sugar phosphate permease
MKYPTYFVTLLAYTTVHMMRMSLTFAQLKLMQFFGINNFEIGIANACLYIVLGISYFWRALYPIK